MLIGFRGEIAFPLDEDARAQATIEALGLNREALVEFRFDHLAPLRLLRQALPLLPADSEEANDILALFEAAVLPGAQYSSMIRALLAEPA